ncbi:MAG: 2'-5' RNA ligase family protein [Chitinophagaceae bacterium]
MQTIVNTIPGYRVYEYLLVLRPQEELRNRMVKVKEDFSVKYKTGKTISGGSQIILASFAQYAMKEERIINRLQAVAMGYPPFKVELKDFGSFPSHTICINVNSKLPIQNLVKEIRKESQRLMKLSNDNKPHFILDPHFTIATKLRPWQYEKGWLEYSKKHFNGWFIASGMSLLKRAAGEMKYHLVQQLEFQHLPVITRQGELF